MLYLKIFLLFLSLIVNTFAIGPFTIIGGISGAVGGLGVTYNYLYCLKKECCDDSWVKFNYEGLESNFTELLYGQHIAQNVVLNSLDAHFSVENPKKALVMSFHGPVGTGKNLVATLIAKNMFWEGPKSNFLRLYMGSLDFPHRGEEKKYRLKLTNDIEMATRQCERNLFVFDEVDKMAPGVLDAVSPYVDYHESMQGVDYRKNIFIFMSNAGGNNITALALKLWSEGKEREAIKFKDIEGMVTWNAFNEIGGLQHSDIIKKSLIDAFVPFLPLEKKHVIMCIKSELRARRRPFDESLVNAIASQMDFVPQSTALFSASGCKKINLKLHYF